MTANKRTVDQYMDGFRRTDHGQIMSCLTDDVEREIPGTFHLRGREAFDKEIENEAFLRPATTAVARVRSGNPGNR